MGDVSSTSSTPPVSAISTLNPTRPLGQITLADKINEIITNDYKLKVGVVYTAYCLLSMESLKFLLMLCNSIVQVFPVIYSRLIRRIQVGMLTTGQMEGTELQ